jgi:hypothetical protein
MKNHELRAEIRKVEKEAHVNIVNPGIDGCDHERFSIGKVTYLNGLSPEDTIIEASREPESLPAGNLLDSLEELDPDADAQVYVTDWEGQGFAYFDIANVRVIDHTADIILGAWRCGGS